MTRSAESIAFNVVEGCGSTTQKELGRFLEISIKSTSELEYQLKLAADYGVLGMEQSHELNSETIDIRKMLCGLRSKVLSSDHPAQSITDNGQTENGTRRTRHG